ncbi:MAG: hypothetical protein AAGF59_09765, partial [Pseudomonadota bacterium]
MPFLADFQTLRSTTAAVAAVWAVFGLAGPGTANPADTNVVAQNASVRDGSFVLASATPVPRAKPGRNATASQTVTVPSQTTSESISVPRLSAGDPGSLRAALDAVANGRGAQAIGMRDGLRDPIDRKIIDWRLARSGDSAVSSAFITQFAIAEPDWPSQKLLRRRAEQALAREKPAPARVLQAFKGLEPVSTRGTLLLARAHEARGDKKSARALVRDLWRTERLSAAEEKSILSEFKSNLTREDHKVRVHMFLYDDRTKAALRTAVFLNGDQRKLVDAWVAVVRKSSKANALLKAVPQSQRSEPGYVFARVKYLRRNKQEEAAIKALLDAPTKAGTLIDPDEWWVERRIVSRMALDRNRARDAYRIASAHSAESPARFAEAEFHAGWYALRFLNDPGRAQRHFQEIEKIGKTPITRSRAFYWLGRAAEAQGKNGDSRRFYRAAAEYKTAFYGQLAKEKLGS